MITYEVYEDDELAKHREDVLKHNPRMYSLFKKRALNVLQTASSGLHQVVG